MREIKFRGKSLTTGDWLYGSLFNDGAEDYILPNLPSGAVDYEMYQVDQNTIGQFTGLLDKNGKEIYEGDIITCINKSDSVYEIGRQMIGFVAYEENGCYWFCKNNFQHYNDWAFADDIEVIGNIYDNEELLKEK